MDDEPDDRDFSKQLVFDFFDQADGTFRQMDDARYLNSPFGLPYATC